jgi:hypothetical protein
VAAHQKNAAAAGATLAFTDESGFLMAPLTRTSLAPAGRTPVFRVPEKDRKKVSVVAALCVPAAGAPAGRARLYHESLPDGYVDDDSYSEFLRRRVLGRVRGPVVLLHDGGQVHRGDEFDFLTEDFARRLTVEAFPAYSPELNPVEQLWNWAKGERMLDLVPSDLGQLLAAVEHTLGQARRDQQRLRSFLKASDLRW